MGICCDFDKEINFFISRSERDLCFTKKRTGKQNHPFFAIMTFYLLRATGEGDHQSVVEFCLLHAIGKVNQETCLVNFSKFLKATQQHKATQLDIDYPDLN